MFNIDASEFAEVGREFSAKSKRSTQETRAIVEKGAVNIKKRWAESAATSRHFKQIAPTVNYDMRDTASAIEAEIGPDKGKPSGRLGNIYHFGTSRGGGTGGDPIRFLEAEESDFAAHLADKAGEL